MSSTAATAKADSTTIASSKAASSSSNTLSSSHPASTSSSPSSKVSSSTSSASSTASSSPQCYVMINSSISIPNWVPCGQTNSSTPNVPCCASGDFCLSNGLCHYTHSLDGGSGYYAAGCTDKTYEDTAACPLLCDDRAKKDVVYNASSGLWNCCGQNANGNPDCPNPTNETFDAPADDQLQTYYTAGSTPAKTSTSSSASRTISRTPSTKTSAASSGLSSGAAAGIGVACGIVGLALIGALIYFFWRRSRRRRGLRGSSTPYSHPPAEMATEANRQPPSELASDVYGSAAAKEEPKEQEPEIPPSELPANEVPRRDVSHGEAPRSDLPDGLRIQPPRT